jgi:superfamily II DNA or RNA helicase
VTITLRDYQHDAIAALESDFASGLQRCGISAPTGIGKTVIMSHLAHRYADRGQRALILVHRDELVRQTVSKLLAIDSSVSIGVVKAGENRGGAAIVVASIQTIARPKRLAQLGRFGLIICDEAHRSMSDQWQTPLRALGAGKRPGADVAGFSATWSRADKRELGGFWQKISLELTAEWAIEQGHLVRPIGKYIRTDIRLDGKNGVKKIAGDYSDKALGVKLARESVRSAIVAGYQRFAADRSGVVFAPTVDTAEFFREGFTAAGITTEGLYGSTRRDDALLMHKRHESGETQVLMTCVRLSEGWDAPWCSAAVIARPTTHQGLFVQQVGRVLRPHADKTDAVILDPTGVLFKHTLEGFIDLSTSERPDEEDEREQDDELPTEVVPREQSEGFLADVVGYEDVPLFAESEAHWLRTRGGTRFVYASPQVVFMIEDEIGFLASVGWCDTHDVTKGGWLSAPVPVEQAQAIAARHALKINEMRAKTGQHWRRRPVTLKQKGMARRELGLTDRALRVMTEGTLFDVHATKLASELLDPVQSWQ